MSEGTPPYRIAAPVPGFMPHPSRFRVWDGERMWEHGALDVVLNTDVAVHTVIRDASGEPSGLTPRPDWVALFSTGLADTEGHEVWAGDVVRRYVSGEGVDAVVERQQGGFAFVPSLGPGTPDWITDYVHPTGPLLLGRVIGNVFEKPDLVPGYSS